MFTKKNMIVIALIAIFVMGSVALNAAYYYVHVTSNHSGTGYVWLEDCFGNEYDRTGVTYVNGTINITLNAPDEVGVDAHAEGTNGNIYDHDWHWAQPFYHTYLELDLAPCDPNKTPETQ